MKAMSAAFDARYTRLPLLGTATCYAFEQHDGVLTLSEMHVGLDWDAILLNDEYHEQETANTCIY